MSDRDEWVEPILELQNKPLQTREDRDEWIEAILEERDEALQKSLNGQSLRASAEAALSLEVSWVRRVLMRFDELELPAPQIAFNLDELIAAGPSTHGLPEDARDAYFEHLATVLLRFNYTRSTAVTKRQARDLQRSISQMHTARERIIECGLDASILTVVIEYYENWIDIMNSESSPREATLTARFAQEIAAGIQFIEPEIPLISLGSSGPCVAKYVASMLGSVGEHVHPKTVASYFSRDDLDPWVSVRDHLGEDLD